MFVCTYVHTNTHTCICTCVYTYTHTYIRIYIHTYIQGAAERYVSEAQNPGAEVYVADSLATDAGVRRDIGFNYLIQNLMKI